MLTKTQIAKLKATGKVADVEDGSMDEGRFFVHLIDDCTWNDGYGIQHTKSFGSFRDAQAALRTVSSPSPVRALRSLSGSFDPGYEGEGH